VIPPPFPLLSALPSRSTDGAGLRVTQIFPSGKLRPDILGREGAKDVGARTGPGSVLASPGFVLFSLRGEGR